MTDKLYYSDSHLFDFTARVLECTETKDGWSLVLDRTAFFPEGGGQQPDTGTAGGGKILRADEADGIVYHLCTCFIEPGSEISCSVDREQRLRRMQSHSGEHIVSGWVHRLFGLDNVGFHMGADCMTIDFSGELTAGELGEVERRANETIRDNLEIRTYFPAPEELAQIDYRSKLELTENVRLVEIPGVDTCACCAPHVSRTGEIGIIKILTRERHRGGIRISLVCGMDAYEQFCLMQDNVTAVSNVLSARRGEIAAAVEKLAGEKAAMAAELAAMSRELVKAKAALYPETEGNICLFESGMNEPAQRELVNLLTAKCGGIAAVFCGSDDDGYNYIISSRSKDLRAASREINAGISGRGGGTKEMIRGKASASAKEIENFLKTL